jgi:hypothetical protein
MNEKILVYLGPSLSLTRAREILPEAIYHSPAKQGDIVTDVVNLSPSIIILLDGIFHENLSVWHKEIVYALQYPGVAAIYGAASMGALRAAELDWIGMVGIGRIYEWYRDGVTEDDSEVALLYAEKDSIYYPQSVPLCDIRAGVAQYQKEYEGQPVAESASGFLESMRNIHYTKRTKNVCEQCWGDRFDGVPFPCLPQKALDAACALNDFRAHQPNPKQRPTPDNLSRFFQALYERDRQIKVNGSAIPQQHIDAYVLLHHPEYERICWDSANQELALMLCDQLLVTVSMEEVERENVRFQARCGIETAADFECMLQNNGWSRPEYDRLIIQNTRIRKLQHANTVTKMYRRNSQQIIDYLRTYQAFDYWAVQAVQAEIRIKESGVDDWLGVNLERGSFALLADHFEKEGLELNCNHEEYLLETGFSNLAELSVALERLRAAGKEG